MIEAFLCSAREDGKYLALTVRMLEFHRIAVWPDVAGLPTDGVRADHDRLDHAIRTADRMLLMITGAALDSAAVADEVAAYRAARPDAPVLPLLFDDVPPGELLDGLLDRPGALRPIRFFDDLDAGYAELVHSFDRAYLPMAERRGAGDRRSVDRRRGDQRRASTVTRLRIGMWKNFATATGYGEYDDFGHPDGTEPGSGRVSAVNRLATVFAATTGELSRYHLVDRDTGAEARLGFDAVRALALAACQEVAEHGRLRNIYVVEQLADLIVRRYDVRQRDRRSDERRSGRDRRAAPPDRRPR
jgi:hypothetical protein